MPLGWRGAVVGAFGAVLLLGAPEGGLAAQEAEGPLPAPTGPHPVGTAQFWMTDATRSDDLTGERAVKVVLRYPATPGSGRTAPYLNDLEARRPALGSELAEAAGTVRTHARRDAIPATAGAPFPLVVLSPSLGGLPAFYAVLSEELASRGYVVAALGHPGDSGPLLLEGRVVPTSSAWQENDPSRVGVEAYFSFREERERVWVGDALHVVAGLGRREVGGRRLREVVDTSRVAYVGHSLGGSAAAMACSRSRAFDACANLDGWPLPAGAESGLAQPYLHVEETRPFRTREVLEGWGATREEYDANMWALAARKDSMFQAMESEAYHLVVDGLSHDGFSDLPLFSASAAASQPLPARRGATVLRTWIAWFLDAHLRGDPAARPPDARDFPEVRFTAYGSSWTQDRPRPEP